MSERPSLEELAENIEHARWLIDNHVPVRWSEHRTRCPICECWYPCAVVELAATALLQEREAAATRARAERAERFSAAFHAALARQRRGSKQLAESYLRLTDDLWAANDARRQAERRLRELSDVVRATLGWLRGEHDCPADAPRSECSVCAVATMLRAALADAPADEVS